MILTKDYIHKHKSVRGGWSKKQLNALGIDFPPDKGWIDNVIGNQISDLQKKEFELITIKDC